MHILTRALPALAALIVLLAPAPVRAEPVAVALAPASAEVTEAGTLALEEEGGALKAVLTLPAKADPASLRVTAPGLVPVDVRVRSVLRRDEGRIKDVRDRLDAARAERQAKADRMAAHQGAAQYWRSLSGGEYAPQAGQAKAMAQALREGLAEELAAASALARDIADRDRAIKELEDELQRLTGGGQRVQEAQVSFSGPPASSAKAVWTYRLSDAGWTPHYTLNALPAENRVAFSWVARVHQNSGAPWKGVALTLVTAQPGGGHEPPDLPPWLLRPEEPVLARAAKIMESRPMLMEAAADNLAAGAPSRPRSEGRVFDSYDAGRADLASGEPRNLPMGHAAWKADFDYLLRPYMGPEAYVRAAVALDEPPRLPSGEAVFLLDSVLLRKGGFSLFAREADLFFGVDPGLTVRLTPLSRQSGTSGLLGTKNSQTWDWRVGVENAKRLPVAVRMEDRMPDAADERIKIEKRLPGAKEEEGGIAVWEFDVPAGGRHVLEYGYTVTCPKDMRLDLGGR